MKNFELVAVGLPAIADPSIAIAASRAGGIGVLDLQYTWQAEVALAAIGKMARYARNNCAIRLDSRADDFLSQVTAHFPEPIGIVILTPCEQDRLGTHLQLLHQRSLRVMLEVTCEEEACTAEKVGVDGLIAKGHEAGGWVGEETTFILLQRLLRSTLLPVWAHGGIGLHTAAACYAAGAAGVVLDSQLLLMRESRLPDEVKASIERMDGSETICLGEKLGAACRVYNRAGFVAIEELRRTVECLSEDPRSSEEVRATWRQAVRDRVGWESPERNVWLVGQDAAFAAPLAKCFRTVGGVLEGIRKAIENHVRSALALRPLDEAAPLAVSHGTRYPIVQGPMTRVSDKAAFAGKVAEAGGLPFLALALMRAPDVRALLEETGCLLGDRPWGVGILGFVPLELRQEQLQIIRSYRPPFALIAGGRPDQAHILEEEGISTYLHVPSPGLLKMFLESGARRFVFEGRECGGHVGPRSSFVLWNTMIDVILESLPDEEIGNCHILFAAGIHDALSASMVASMAAPLAERGAKIGVLLGTAYLFTEEAVATGAIVKGFQEAAIQCTRTVLLETGPGHSTRCVHTPYADVFEGEKRQLYSENRSPEEIRDQLERLNLGRLRLASKGIAHRHVDHQDPSAPRYVTVSEAEQRLQGMYMIGQLAALRDRSCTIEELHRDVAIEGSRRLERIVLAPDVDAASLQKTQSSEIAIVGMSCILPKAKDLNTYWENILNKVNAIAEIPKQRWDWKLYYDPDPKAKDKIYSKWGGFIDDVAFDPVEYGMPPNSLSSIDPMQLLALKVARAALDDAGYLERPFDRARTSVILGASGGTGDLGGAYLLRASLPLLFRDAASDVVVNTDGALPEWTEDTFAGLLLNVAAGRIANRFDFGGFNYIVDAACASSLAAVHLAVKELETHNSDIVIAGGFDTTQNPFGYLCFSKTQALSRTGQARTFDASADGIAIGEGIAILVLKRLADAERDGDRIYAVIQGVGGSSDGKAKGLTAPRPEGQMLALERAYAKAGFSPSTVELVEAHGTGTVVGDRTEAQALSTFLEETGARPQSCAIGSVKSMIGHTKAAAGVASLVKVALALHHKILPPTLGVTQPNSFLQSEKCPLYINTETRPWIHGINQYPRRAGVSSFGFGGTNFHAVLEEYCGDFVEAAAAPMQEWPSELMLFAASSRQELVEMIEHIKNELARGSTPVLRDLSHTLWELAKEQSSSIGASPLRLAVVSDSLSDLRGKLLSASEKLRASERSIHDPRGIYFTEDRLGYEGKIAFLFPGQGSQYVDMLGDLAIQFPEVRERFEVANRVLVGCFADPLSSYVFPPPRFSEEERRSRQRALTRTDVAQPAIGAADMGLFYLLAALGVQPTMVAGHSYGEYVALCASGAFDEEVLYKLSEARGRFILEAAGLDPGTMAAVDAGRETVYQVVRWVKDVWVANINSPRQTIISGTAAGVEEAVRRLEAHGIPVRPIAVACAFHSPLIAGARDRLVELLSSIKFHAPRIEVFSNASAGPYSREPQAVAALMAEHLVRPVEFSREIEAMYDAGARTFLEVGPRNLLTSLTQQILGARRYLALALDMPGRSGLIQLLHTLAQLAAHGVPVQLDRLYRGRRLRRLSLAELVEETKEQPLSPTAWLVDGGRARPLRDASSSRTRKETSRQEILNIHTSPTATPQPTDAADQAVTRVDTASDPSVQKNAPQPSEPAAAPRAPATSVRAPEQTVMSTVSPSNGDAAQVMLRYQGLMSRFLETQQQVMLAFLRRSHDGTTQPSTTVPSAEIHESPPSQVEEPTSEPAQQPVVRSPLPVAPRSDGVASPAASATGSSELSNSMSFQESEPYVDDREELTRKLLEIVAARTGYPPDMLQLDLNIEADLGIDSIKRVEILGALQRSCFPPEHKSQELMEKLTAIKTLRGIIELVHSSLLNRSQGPVSVGSGGRIEMTATQRDSRHEADNSQRGISIPEEGDCAGDSGIEEVKLPRFVLTSVDLPLSVAPPASPSADGLFLITDDERGVAQAMAAELRDRGGHVVLVRANDKFAKAGGDIYTVNLTQPESVVEFVEQVRQQHGPIHGIIHLLPLSVCPKFEEMDLKEWRRRLYLEVKSLFYLARAAGPDLKETGGWLLAATVMGGAFASDNQSAGDFFPGQGGVAGLVKTVALEWPGVRCKVVDLDPQFPAKALAGELLGEMTSQDKEVQVGYNGSRRLVLRPSLDPLRQNGPAKIEIDSSWIILVTGGARGITAEVACELAARYRPTLLLVGHSPLPETEESPQTTRLTSPQELKAALMGQMREAGGQVTLARLEAAYSRLLKDREIRNNLARIQRAGATVRYYQADVRNEHAMANLIEAIYRDYRRLDGVIHGAGVIDDKLLEDKTPDSFDRVFDTKADSAFLLSRMLRPDTLQFLVFFSSVAGCFGNRGQTDYAAANAVLNSLAIRVDKKWPARVVAINWGPWKKTGMVSAEIERQFTERGLKLIEPTAGCRTCDEELKSARKGEVEIVLGSGPWQTKASESSLSTSQSLPLLDGVSISPGNGASVEIIYPLDPSRDVYLQDHKVDGKPVLAAAMAMELMAEVVQKGWPGSIVVSLREFMVLRGIVVDNEPRPVRVVAHAETPPTQGQVELSIDVRISDPMDGRPFYRTTVLLADALQRLPTFEASPPAGLRPFPMTPEEAYSRWLFQGPFFQGIVSIDGLSEEGIVATFGSSSFSSSLTGNGEDAWLIHPVAVDSAFQLAILWARVHYDMTPLPSRFRSFTRFDRLAGSTFRCYFKTKASAGGHVLETQAAFLSADGRLLALLDDMEFTCSRSLNRIGGYRIEGRAP